MELVYTNFMSELCTLSPPCTDPSMGPVPREPEGEESNTSKGGISAKVESSCWEISRITKISI